MSVMTKLKSQHQLLNKLEARKDAKVNINIRNEASKKEIEESQKLKEDENGASGLRNNFISNEKQGSGPKGNQP